MREREREREKAKKGKRDEERLPNKAKSQSHKTRPPRGCTQNPNPKLPSAEMGQQPRAESKWVCALELFCGDKHTIMAAIVDECVW